MKQDSSTSSFTKQYGDLKFKISSYKILGTLTTLHKKVFVDRYPWGFVCFLFLLTLQSEPFILLSILYDITINHAGVLYLLIWG